MGFSLRLFLLAGVLALGVTGATAQPAPAAAGAGGGGAPPGDVKPLAPAGAAGQAAPSGEAMTLARTLVEKSGTGGMGVLFELRPPVPALLTSLGVTDLRHRRVVNRDAIMATFAAHQGDLDEIQAHSYASTMSVADMKAAIAFYSSPAGVDFQRLRSTVTRAEIGAGHEVVGKHKQELAQASQAALKAHGFVK